MVPMIKSNPRVSALQEKLGGFLKFLPMTPNQLTVLSVVFSIIGLFFFIHSSFWAAFLLYGLAFVIDGLDGALARAKGLVSSKGAFLDGVADRFVEFFILVGFVSLDLPVLLFPPVYWIFSLVFFGTCMTSFIKAYADHRKAIPPDSAANLKGILERAERSILIMASVLFVCMGMVDYSLYLLVAASILAIITVFQRIFSVLRA